MDTGIGLIAVIFLVVLGILWILLPFAVFGTKDLLQELINETKANTAAVKALQDAIKPKDN